MTLQTHIPDEDSSTTPHARRMTDECVSRRDFRAWVKGAVAGFAILAGGLAWALHVNSADADKQRAKDNDARAQRIKDAAEERDAIVRSGRAVSVAGCNRDYRTIKTVRLVFITSKNQVLAARLRGDINDRQYRRAVRFYNHQLRQFTLPDCRLARAVVTDDPSKTVIVPVPLHPGG